MFLGQNIQLWQNNTFELIEKYPDLVCCHYSESPMESSVVCFPTFFQISSFTEEGKSYRFEAIEGETNDDRMIICG